MPVVHTHCDGCELGITVRRKESLYVREYYPAATRALNAVGIPSTVVGRAKKPRAGKPGAGATRSVLVPEGYIMLGRPQGAHLPVWMHLDPEALVRDESSTMLGGQRSMQALYDEFHTADDPHTGSDVYLRSLTACVDTTEFLPWEGIRADISLGDIRLDVCAEDYGDGRYGVRIQHGYGRIYAKDIEMRRHPESAWMGEILTQGGWDGVEPLTRVEVTCAGEHLPSHVKDLTDAWLYWMSSWTIYRPETRDRPRRFRDREVDPDWANLQALSFPSIARPDLGQRVSTPLSDLTRLSRNRGQARAFLVNWAVLAGLSLQDPKTDLPALIRDDLRDPVVEEAVRAKIRAAQVRYGKTEGSGGGP